MYILCLQQDLYLNINIKFLTMESILDVEDFFSEILNDSFKIFNIYIYIYLIYIYIYIYIYFN